MRSNHSQARRSRVRPSDDDSPPENRPRPVQKAVQYIPEEHLPAWGVRWGVAPLQKLDKPSGNSSVPVFKLEHGLSEFKVNLPPDDHPPSIPPVGYSHSGKRKNGRTRRRPNHLPSSLQQLASTEGPGLYHQTPLAPDEYALSIPPVVCSLSDRPAKRMNRRTRKRPSYLTSSFQQSQSTSTRADSEESGLDTSTSGLCSATSQTESVASSPLSGGPITPEIGFYPVLQCYDNRSLSIPMYSYYQHEVLAGSPNQRGSQSLPYGAMARGSTVSQLPVPSYPDTAVAWTPENETSSFPSIVQPYYHHGPDTNHREVDAMGHGTFHNHSSSDPRFPHWHM